MIEIEANTIVRKSPEEVMSFVSDFENAPKWQTGVVRSELVTPPPVRAGSRFEEDVKVALWKMRATCEVTKYDAPRLIAFHTTSTGPIEYGGEFRFEPVHDGTRVVVRGQVRLKGLWKLIQPLFAADIRKETQAEMNTLKRVLEGDAGSGAIQATN